MSRNDITGDEIKSGLPSKLFEEGYERIFGKKDKCPSCGLDLTVPQGYVCPDAKCPIQPKAS
jgi:hypothetical protein